MTGSRRAPRAAAALRSPFTRLVTVAASLSLGCEPAQPASRSANPVISSSVSLDPSVGQPAQTDHLVQARSIATECVWNDLDGFTTCTAAQTFVRTEWSKPFKRAAALLTDASPKVRWLGMTSWEAATARDRGSPDAADELALLQAAVAEQPGTLRRRLARLAARASGDDAQVRTLTERLVREGPIESRTAAIEALDPSRGRWVTALWDEAAGDASPQLRISRLRALLGQEVYPGRCGLYLAALGDIDVEVRNEARLAIVAGKVREPGRRICPEDALSAALATLGRDRESKHLDLEAEATFYACLLRNGPFGRLPLITVEDSSWVGMRRREEEASLALRRIAKDPKSPPAARRAAIVGLGWSGFSAKELELLATLEKDADATVAKAAAEQRTRFAPPKP